MDLISDAEQASILNNIIMYSQSSKFIKFVVSIIIGLKYKNPWLRNIEKAFNVFDTKFDGFMSAQELEDAAKRLNFNHNFTAKCNWKDVHKARDLCGDGRVDFHEFYAAGVDHTELLTRQHIDFVFNMLDTNCDNKIDIPEFIKHLPTNFNNEGKVNNHKTGPLF